MKLIERFEALRFELGPRTDTPERLKGHRAWFDRRVVDLRHAFEVLGFETDDLIRQRGLGPAALNVAMNVVLGLAAVAAGRIVARRLSP